MTTLGTARARGRRTLLWTVGSALLSLGLTLGGCGSSSNILGGSSTPAPQATLTQPQHPSATQTARIQIAPVIGSPENVARDLQAQLATSMTQRGITVATAQNAASEYVLRGYIVAARERSRTKISYIWDITDPSGNRVHRITGEKVAPLAGKDPWSAVTPRVVQDIVDSTASQIATWLPNSGGVPMASAATPTASSSATAATNALYQTAATTSPRSPASTTGSIDTSGPITAVVPMVTGAPGDGRQSLTEALQRELSKNGVALSNSTSGNSYKVQGQVAMGQSKDGKQPIQIEWNVIDPSGKKLGTVSQKNEVPQGSLDGAWGKTADAAAAAAAQGIIKLLPQTSTN